VRELRNELEKTLVQRPEVLKSELEAAFDKLRAQMHEVRKNVAELETRRAELAKESGELEDLKTHRRAKILADLQPKAAGARGQKPDES